MAGKIERPTSRPPKAAGLEPTNTASFAVASSSLARRVSPLRTGDTRGLTFTVGSPSRAATLKRWLCSILVARFAPDLAPDLASRKGHRVDVRVGRIALQGIHYRLEVSRRHAL